MTRPHRASLVVGAALLVPLSQTAWAQPLAPATAPAPQAASSSPPAASSPAAPPPGSASAAPASTSTGAALAMQGVGRGSIYARATTWDLNLEGGYGRELGPEGRGLGWGRLRAGILWIREPTFYALGLTSEIGQRQNLSFGLQGEVTSLSVGLWLQLGGFVDVKGHLGGSVAAGWSLFGAELQRRHAEGLGTETVVLGKLRIPLGVISYYLLR